MNAGLGTMVAAEQSTAGAARHPNKAATIANSALYHAPAGPVHIQIPCPTNLRITMNQAAHATTAAQYPARVTAGPEQQAARQQRSTTTMIAQRTHARQTELLTLLRRTAHPAAQAKSAKAALAHSQHAV